MLTPPARTSIPGQTRAFDLEFAKRNFQFALFFPDRGLAASGHENKIDFQTQSNCPLKHGSAYGVDLDSWAGRHGRSILNYGHQSAISAHRTCRPPNSLKPHLEAAIRRRIWKNQILDTGPRNDLNLHINKKK
jgi:hypothetical protein